MYCKRDVGGWVMIIVGMVILHFILIEESKASMIIDIWWIWFVGRGI